MKYYLKHSSILVNKDKIIWFCGDIEEIRQFKDNQNLKYITTRWTCIDGGYSPYKAGDNCKFSVYLQNNC